MTLTILTVTEYADYAMPFLIGMEALAADLGCDFVKYDGTGADYLENALDRAVAECPDGYILRLDDDEKVSTEMRDWLAAGEYEAADHWAFPRRNLYPDEGHYITSMHLYPDLQTRLSVKEKSGGRLYIHAGSPYGTGQVAPCHIEHHKFLVRSRAERWETVQRYEALQPSAGARFLQFSVPDDMPAHLLTVAARQGAVAA